MTVQAKDVRATNKFYLDGKNKQLGTSTIFYTGYSHSPTDFVIPVESTNFNIPLTNKGVVKRVRLRNRSGTVAYFRLNGNTERYKLKTQTILTFNSTPTSLTIDNDSEDDKIIIEVTVIGEES